MHFTIAHKSFAVLRWASLALALATAACTQTPVHETGTLLQRADQLLRQAPVAPGVTLNIAPQQIVTGGALTAHLQTATPGYAYLFQIGTDGRSLNLVFPNAHDNANYVNGGPLTLPRQNWRLTARGPQGVGYLLAVVTREPQDLLRLIAAAEAGQFAIIGPYQGAMATLQEVAP